MALHSAAIIISPYIWKVLKSGPTTKYDISIHRRITSAERRVQRHLATDVGSIYDLRSTAHQNVDALRTQAAAAWRPATKDFYSTLVLSLVATNSRVSPPGPTPSSRIASSIDWVKVLRPIRHKIGHFGDVLSSQSLGLVSAGLRWVLLMLQH